MEKFTGDGVLVFTDKFKTDLDCLKYLAAIKWENVISVQNVSMLNLQSEAKVRTDK